MNSNEKYAKRFSFIYFGWKKSATTYNRETEHSNIALNCILLYHLIFFGVRAFSIFFFSLCKVLLRFIYYSSTGELLLTELRHELEAKNTQKKNRKNRAQCAMLESNESVCLVCALYSKTVTGMQRHKQ